MAMLNDGLKQHLIDSLRKGIRYDGRVLDAYRPITIERDVTRNAEGSARVKLGDTEVIAGIKLMVGQPYADSPEDGNLVVGVELSPMASPDFELGPPSIEAIELARVVDRGIRESKAIDSKKLCIIASEKVWVVSIDVCIVNHDGNLLDACALATLAALQDTHFPKYEGNKVDYSERTSKKLELKKLPLLVTVYKTGDNLFVDPTPEEEMCYDAKLSVTTVQNGDICALQKGGEKPITQDDISKMTDLALVKAKEMRKLLK